MTLRTCARIALSAALLASLTHTATAREALPLRVHLRIVDSCALERSSASAPCTTAHQRSDADRVPPPQVQSLTPPPEGDDDLLRPWLTLTF